LVIILACFAAFTAVAQPQHAFAQPNAGASEWKTRPQKPTDPSPKVANYRLGLEGPVFEGGGVLGGTGRFDPGGNLGLFFDGAISRDESLGGGVRFTEWGDGSWMQIEGRYFIYPTDKAFSQFHYGPAVGIGLTNIRGRAAAWSVGAAFEGGWQYLFPFGLNLGAGAAAGLSLQQVRQEYRDDTWGGTLFTFVIRLRAMWAF